jgi:ABC-type nitrate/sulfonate/bicarbonate transport system permease component
MAFFNRFWSVLFVLILVALWSFISFAGLVDPIILPSPPDVLRAFPKIFVEDNLIKDVGYTLFRVFSALILAAVLGIPFGLLLGYYKDLYRIFEGPLHALRSIPATALFPLLLLVIGVGNLSIVVLAAYPSLLIIMVNTVSGVSLANKRRIYQAEVLGANLFGLMRDVLIYESLPNILDGIRTSISYSLALIVAVEMFIGIENVGLGRRIYDYQSAYQIPQTYATIIITGGLGIVFNLILNLAERRLLRWMPDTQYEN